MGTVDNEQRNVSSIRQFGALVNKNFLLKLRRPLSLLLEILLPIVFMALMALLAGDGSAKTEEAAIIESSNYPVPSLEYLYSQATGDKILCYDNNLFNYCSCKYEKGDNAIISEEIGDFYSDGFYENPVQALFLSAHNLHTYFGICYSLQVIYQAEPTICQSYYDMKYFCGTLVDDIGDSTGSCNELDSVLLLTVDEAEAVIDRAITAADYNGAGTSIPDDAGACTIQRIAIIPMNNETSSLDEADRSPEEDAAVKFYDRLSLIFGEDYLYTFMSSDELDEYVKDSDYTKTSDLPILSAAVVFNQGFPNWDYSLRSNFTKMFYDGDTDYGYRVMGVPLTGTATTTSFRNAYSTGEYQGRIIYPFSETYYTSGLLSIQQEVDMFIMEQNGITNTLQYRIGFFPSDTFIQYDFWPNVGSMFAVVMVLVLMYPVSNVIRSIVVDKELKLKEGMLQMGLGPKVYTLSWIFQFTVIFFIISVLLTLIGSGGVFRESDGGIVFFFFFLFFMATVAVSFFIASFFDKARSAATYGGLFFFVTVFPYFGVSSDGASRSSRLGICVLPSSCFGVGTLPFVEYEGSGIGVTSSNFSSTDQINVSMADIFGMLVFDIFLYTLLSWYVGQVMPSEWGTQRPWNFLFTKAYWRPEATAREDASMAEAALQEDETRQGLSTIEDVSEALRSQIGDSTCVAIRSLTKTYPSPSNVPFKAVDNLTLTMYKNQITALLGHNGAGKTTTMNMLTGMVPVTSGRAYVNGLDVNTQMTKIRQNLGVCPQHDILYPDLTVSEHLRMFATFKGIPFRKVNSEVKAMIQAVGLVEKKNEKSSSLSGGQKRKLSVAIAFIGGSQVVFLDEPTSGMDPHSRRFTWDVIRRQKEGRIVVLTTHFMDEADLLGDRIAIMGRGELKCCGSSLFLKGLYGVGYNLTIVKTIEGTEDEEFSEVEDMERKKQQMENASKEIKSMVRSFVPAAQQLSDVGAEVSFQLPTSASNVFKDLFDHIDKNKKSLCVGQYGMSITTLEEVFIRVANGTENQLDREELSMLRQQSSKSFRLLSGRNESEKKTAAYIPVGDEFEQKYKMQEMSTGMRFTRHMVALTIKRGLTYKRDKKMICFTLLAPSIFVLIGLLILLVFPNIDQPSLVLSPDEYNTGISSSPRNPIPYTNECDTTVGTADTCEIDDLTGQYTQDYGMELIEATDAANSTVAALNEWMLSNNNFDSKAIIYGAYVWNDVSLTAAVGVDITVLSNYSALHAAPTYINQISNAVFKMASGDDSVSITTRIHPFDLTQFESGIDDNYNSFPTVLFLMVGFAFIPAAWCGFIVKERESKTKHQQVVSGVNLIAYWGSTYAWDMLSFLLTPLLVLLFMAIVGQSDSIIGDADSALACFLLMLLWGPASMGFTYCFSFFFKDHSSSMTSTLFVNWVFGLICPIAVFFMLLFQSTKEAAKTLKWILRIHPGYCLGDGMLNLGNRLIVQFAFGLDNEPAPFDSLIAGSNLTYMAIEILAYALLLTLFEKLFSGTKTISAYLSEWVFTYRMRRNRDPNSFWNSDLAAPGESGLTEDEDVVAERARVQRNDSDVILIQGLRKAYPVSTGTKIAVRNTWLGIPKGQCFALLGINGAGKTTTISILCGEQKPTTGAAYLAGIDVVENAEATRRLVGYCPQFDALFETMTGREHLTMFARIKGIPESEVADAVQAKIVEMDLTQYADKFAGGYSGGNKRKLSVAIAMIGGPEIVFLDEPSTGVDPVARRHMWEVISRIVTTNKECALVLTTHSMEEAEALCQRIGIMVGGRMRCLGSAQHLKSRFGSGYMLEVTAALPTKDELSSAVAKLEAESGELDMDKAVEALYQHFPKLVGEMCPEGRGAILSRRIQATGSIEAIELASWALQESACSAILEFFSSEFDGAELVEKQEGKLRLSLPQQEGMTLGTIFGLIEQHRQALRIGEYALGQTSLEQIFNMFAAQQEEETHESTSKREAPMMQQSSRKILPEAAAVEKTV